MLVRLLYASRAAESVDADALGAILKRSKEHNPSAGVTGVLCFCADAHIFMQVLEGGRSAVSALYNAHRRRTRATATSPCSATRRSASAASPAGPWAR